MSDGGIVDEWAGRAMDEGMTIERLAYRTGEAADILGMSTSKLSAVINAHDVPVVMVGTAMRIPAEGLRPV